jgi:hypothetical protein
MPFTLRRHLALRRGKHASEAEGALVEALRDALSPSRVHTSALDRTLYARDASVITGGRCGIVCFPETAAEVQACVRLARHHGAPSCR